MMLPPDVKYQTNRKDWTYMKRINLIKEAWIVMAVLAVTLTGCDKNEKSQPADQSAKPAVVAEQPAKAPAVAEDPAKAKPKDHPAH